MKRRRQTGKSEVDRRPDETDEAWRRKNPESMVAYSRAEGREASAAEEPLRDKREIDAED